MGKDIIEKLKGSKVKKNGNGNIPFKRAASSQKPVAVFYLLLITFYF